jgi:hypothetical protein
MEGRRKASSPWMANVYTSPALTWISRRTYLSLITHCIHDRWLTHPLSPLLLRSYLKKVLIRRVSPKRESCDIFLSPSTRCFKERVIDCFVSLKDFWLLSQATGLQRLVFIYWRSETIIWRDWDCFSGSYPIVPQGVRVLQMRHPLLFSPFISCTAWNDDDDGNDNNWIA